MLACPLIAQALLHNATMSIYGEPGVDKTTLVDAATSWWIKTGFSEKAS